MKLHNLPSIETAQSHSPHRHALSFGERYCMYTEGWPSAPNLDELPVKMAEFRQIHLFVLPTHLDTALRKGSDFQISTNSASVFWQNEREVDGVEHQSESEYLLSHYRFTGKVVLRWSVTNRINRRLIFQHGNKQQKLTKHIQRITLFQR